MAFCLVLSLSFYIPIWLLCQPTRVFPAFSYVLHRIYISVSEARYLEARMANVASPGEGKEDSNKQRQSNLQRIQQRKQSVREWPVDKKLEKLAIYSR